MNFSCMPSLTGEASSHPHAHCCPHPLPHAQAAPILCSGVTRHSHHLWRPWQKLPQAGGSRGKLLALAQGQGDAGKGKHREQPARVGGLEQRGFGRSRVPSSLSILRSFTAKNTAGRISKPNTGLDGVQREVDDLVCATHALKIIINQSRTKSELQERRTSTLFPRAEPRKPKASGDSSAEQRRSARGESWHEPVLKRATPDPIQELLYAPHGPGASPAPQPGEQENIFLDERKTPHPSCRQRPRLATAPRGHSTARRGMAQNGTARHISRAGCVPVTALVQAGLAAEGSLGPRCYRTAATSVTAADGLGERPWAEPQL